MGHLRNTCRDWRLATLLVCLVAMPCSVLAQADWVAESAAYGRSVNEVTAGFAELANRSTEFDNLAYAVAEGNVSPDYASLQARRLSADLWSKFTQLSNRLQGIGGPPASVTDRNMRGKLRNVRTMAEQTRSMAQTFITSGEDLVESAIAGDPNIFAEVEERSVRLTAAQMAQQVATYEVQMAYENNQTWSYYLTGALKAQVQAMVTMMNATLASYDSGGPVEFTDEQAEAEAWIQTGFEFIDQGRKVAQREAQVVKSWVPKDERERRMKDLLLELFSDNVTQSFDLEEGVLWEISGLISKYGQMTDEDLYAFQVKVSAMERERARLLLEREERVSKQ